MGDSMSALSGYLVTATGLAMGLIAACTPTRGALYDFKVVVDDPGNFVATGYMGDWKGITETTSAMDAAACSPTRAHADAVGKCHHWTWNFSNDICPVPDDSQRACAHFACVAWIKPIDLFDLGTAAGRAAGLAIAPGATKVRFWAWAPAAAAVRFQVGSADEDLTASLDTQLTTTPQQFEIDIAASSYKVVNRGFQWCSYDLRFDHLDFYVDDIHWAGP